MANTKGSDDVMDSTTNGNYEASPRPSNSVLTMANGGGDSASRDHNHSYTKKDIVGDDDNNELNQLTEKEMERQGRHPDSMAAVKNMEKSPQKSLPDSNIGDTVPQTAADIEIKENALKNQDSEEELEDWQILKRTTIEGQRCKLVPYTADHVPTYNKWLNDPYIQQMTQTEPYSLSQEYEFQKEWMDDRNKYIFIILDRSLDDAMAGDINLFIQNEAESIGELNIMIAEDQSRRKGIATETIGLIIDFAKKHFELKQFVAKIQHDNESSIKLFKKSGFVETEYIEQFKEYTFTLTFEDEHHIDCNGTSNGFNGKKKKKKRREHTDSESESELLERHKGRLQRHDDDDCNSFHTDQVCSKCMNAQSSHDIGRMKKTKNGTLEMNTE